MVAHSPPNPEVQVSSPDLEGLGIAIPSFYHFTEILLDSLSLRGASRQIHVSRIQ